VQGSVQQLSEGIHLGILIDVCSACMGGPLLVPFIEGMVPLVEGVHDTVQFQNRLGWDEMIREVFLERPPQSVVDHYLVQGFLGSVSSPLCSWRSQLEVCQGCCYLSSFVWEERFIEVVVVL